MEHIFDWGETAIGDKIPCRSIAEHPNNSDGITLETGYYSLDEDSPSEKVLLLNTVESIADKKVEAAVWLTTATARDLITSLTYWVTEVERAEEN